MADFIKDPPDDNDLVYRPLYGCVGDVASQEDMDRLRPSSVSKVTFTRKQIGEIKRLLKHMSNEELLDMLDNVEDVDAGQLPKEWFVKSEIREQVNSLRRTQLPSNVEGK